ncbi:putative cupredoxin-like copper-binding protein [Dongia mobilis]|uniref:Putative cupredoxin-like copper-binding protein n=2 Tax=Dongia mobilis TaxID=578943 RepID=A0A4R6WTW1_9PROT|nr:putative cupredoxin-like copper-binding protein [Dongia mobilis]
MMKAIFVTLLAAASLMSATVAANAAGTHEGGHYEFGEPGKAENVTKTVLVDAVDENGEMRFVHEPLTIKQGDVVKFVVTNRGTMPHEFSVGDSPSQRAHALMMEKMPDMKHENDATAITLEPGETKELIWAFTKPIKGQIELACQMPGHYAGGMVTKVRMVK